MTPTPSLLVDVGSTVVKACTQYGPDRFSRVQVEARQEGIAPEYLILPVLTMASTELAYKLRIMRSSMIESLGQDFIDTARSKGLSSNRVLWRHALPNALLPMVTVSGYSLGFILAGSVLVERVFGWPGMGLLFIGAIERQDTFVVLGVVIVITITILVVNVLTDIVYGLVDPRLRARFTRNAKPAPLEPATPAIPEAQR